MDNCVNEHNHEICFQMPDFLEYELLRVMEWSSFVTGVKQCICIHIIGLAYYENDYENELRYCTSHGK